MISLQVYGNACNLVQFLHECMEFSLSGADRILLVRQDHWLGESPHRGCGTNKMCSIDL